MIYSEESVTKRQYSSSSSSSSGDLTYTDDENEASHYLVDRKYESKEDIKQAIQAYSTAVCRPYKVKKADNRRIYFICTNYS